MREGLHRTACVTGVGEHDPELVERARVVRRERDRPFEVGDRGLQVAPRFVRPGAQLQCLDAHDGGDAGARDHGIEPGDRARDVAGPQPRLGLPKGRFTHEPDGASGAACASASR